METAVIKTLKDKNGKSLYPRTKQEAVDGLTDRLSKIESAADITATTEKSMPNSHKGRLMFEEIGGKCEQGSTTGAQLFDASKIATTSTGGATVTNNGDGSFTISGSGEATEMFKAFYKFTHDEIVSMFKTGTLSMKVEQATRPYFFAVIKSEDGSTLFETTNYNEGAVTDDITEDILADETAYMEIGFYLSAGTTIIPGKIKPMLYQDGDGTWEPYTGGQASPNPSYPQEIYTVKGKNLLDCRGLTEQTINGVTFTPAYDDNGNLLYIEANGTATANANYGLSLDFNLPKESYILSGCPSGGANASSYKQYLNHSTNGAVYVDVGNGKTFTNEYDKLSAVIVIYSGYTAKNLRFYPMIRPASVSDATYVPYGLLRVKTHGNNLLDMRKARNGLINGVTVTMNDDGSYLFVGTATNNAINVWLLGNWGTTEPVLTLPAGTYYVQGVCLHNNTSVLAQCTKDTGVIVRFSKDTDITGIRVVQATSGNTYNDTIYPIIAKSDVSVPWEPYTESSVILSEPLELYGIGDVQDVIESGEINRKYVKLNLDVNSIPAVTYYEATNTNRFAISTESLPSIGIANRLMCNIAKAVNGGADTNTCRIYSNIQIFLFLDADEFPDKESLATYLETNEVYFVYELATEEVTALPTADRIALNSLLTYDGATYLEWDCYLEPTFKGKYGTSEVGGYTLEGLLTGRNAELLQQSNSDRITALETALINNV